MVVGWCNKFRRIVDKITKTILKKVGDSVVFNTREGEKRTPMN